MGQGVFKSKYFLYAKLEMITEMILPPLEDNQIKDIERIIENFLWRGTKSKISLRILQCIKEDSGLGLVNIKEKHKALLFNWINDALMNAKIENLAICFLGEHAKEGQIWRYNCNLRDSKLFFPGSSFWHAILHAWHGYSYHEPQNGDKVKEQIIWYNSMVKIGGKLLQVRPTNGSLHTVGQMWDKNHFKAYAAIKKEYGVSMSWYEYHSLISVIPDTWKFFLKTPDLVDYEENFNLINSVSGVSRQVYPDLIRTDDAIWHVCKTWNGKLKEGKNVDMNTMRQYFKNIRFIRNTVKLRDFQYRLLHNKIFCNDILVHWSKVQADKCDFCKTKKQTIIHLMHDCKKN